jgi:hypothetical protein
MYFNQGLLGPDPEPNPAPKPAPEPEIAPNLDPSLRTKKSTFFCRRLLPFHSTPFSAGVKNNKKEKKMSNYFIFENEK